MRHKFASASKPGHEPCNKALFNDSNKLEIIISSIQIWALSNVRLHLTGLLTIENFVFFFFSQRSQMNVST